MFAFLTEKAMDQRGTLSYLNLKIFSITYEVVFFITGLGAKEKRAG